MKQKMGRKLLGVLLAMALVIALTPWLSLPAKAASYTVEFTYDEKQFVMEGDTTVPLRDILDYVGLSGEVTAVEVSDSMLFSASKASGEWLVTAHKAFTSQEWMKVVAGGEAYEIAVTDAYFRTSQTVTLDAMWDLDLYSGGEGKYFVCDGSAAYTINGGETVAYSPDSGETAFISKPWSATINAAGEVTFNSRPAVSLSSGKNAWHLYYNEWASTPYGSGALVWEQVYVAPPTWKITYDKNSGNDNVSGLTNTEENVNQGSSTNLPTPTRTGYTFNGWYTASSGGNLAGKGGASYTPDSDITLYAQWSLTPATAPTITKVNSATLAYGYTSGSVSVTATPANGHTITGYQWYSNASNSNTGGTLLSGANSASYSIPTGKNAGTTEYYYCVVTATRSDNNQTETATSSVATVSVTKATISPTVDITGWTYGENANAPTIGDGSNPGEGIPAYTYAQKGSESFDATQPTQAGDYTVKVTIPETANYQSGTATKDFSISKKPVTITGITAENKPYDGTNTATLVVTSARITGVVGQDELTVSAAEGTFENANAGENKTVNITGFTLDGAAKDNYEVATTGNQANTTASISKKDATITAKEQTVDLDQTTTADGLALDGTTATTGSTKLASAVTVQGLLTTPAQTLTSITLQASATNSLTEAGTVTPSAAVIKQGETDVTENYNITYNTGNLTVTKIVPEIEGTLSVDAITYGDTLSQHPIIGTMKDKHSNEGIIGTFTWDAPGTMPVVADSSTTAYNWTFTPQDGDRYTVVTGTLKVVVNKRTVQLQWDDTELTYDGTPQKPTATVTNLVGSDEVSVTVTGEQTDANAKAGTTEYTATASVLTGDRADNYTLTGTTNPTQTFTIAPKPITDATVTLNLPTDLTYSGNEMTVSIASVTLTDGTVLTTDDFEVSGDLAKTDAGTYTVTVTGKGNYNATATATWTIEPATPTIDTEPTTSEITYGQTLSDSGFINGVVKFGTTDVEGVFTWDEDTTKPEVSDSDNTEYKVIFTPNSTNFKPVECSLKLIVNKAEPAVTKPTTKTLTYTGSAQALVDEGSAEGGTLYYAVTTEDVAPTGESLYTTSIPTATNAGT